MVEGALKRRVYDWDRFLEGWYAPFVVFLGSVALSFPLTSLRVGVFDPIGLTVSFFLSLFLGAANTYGLYVRHNQRVGPIPERI